MHTCPLCTIEKINQTDPRLSCKERLSRVTYPCKLCLRDALETRGEVFITDFRKKANCKNQRHIEEYKTAMNTKCKCCEDATDITYCRFANLPLAPFP